MTLFETAAVRRSVRKYEPRPLLDSELKDLVSFLDSNSGFLPIGIKYEIVGPDAVSDKKAPHYILLYSQVSPGYLVNAGFYLSNIDLYLQSKGYGSCYLGMLRVNNKTAPEGYEFIIGMSFGYPKDTPMRKIEDFKRMAIERICAVDNEIVQFARLAPSAINSQPWFFHIAEGSVTVEHRPHLGIAILTKKFTQIDIGIVCSFINLKLDNMGIGHEVTLSLADKRLKVIFKYK